MPKSTAGERAGREGSDRRLIAACLAGDDRAWAELVDRYRGLVYSVILKRGLDEADAADLFQAVWTQVYLKLESLRELDSIASWLATVTANTCYHWRRKQRRLDARESGGWEDAELDAWGSVPPADPAVEERRLQIRNAIAELPPRCQELIRMLFYNQPTLPYREVAARLGLAVGSIGFIRARCLEKLHRLLDEKGAADDSS